MTNKEYYIKIKQKADNKPEGMGIGQFGELILDIMPRAAWDAKYRPDDVVENEIDDMRMEEKKSCYECGEELDDDHETIRVSESPKDDIRVEVCLDCYEKMIDY